MSGVVLQRLGAPEGLARRFLVACMIFGFAALTLAAIAAFWINGRTAEHTGWVNHTYEVELAVERARVTIEQTETTRRGYLVSQEQIYLDAYREVIATLPARLDTLARLTRDNPEQKVRIAELRARLRELIDARERTIVLVQSGRHDEAVQLFVGEASAKRLRAIRNLFDALTREEQRLLKIRDGELAANNDLFFWVLVAAFILTAAVAAASLATVLRYTKDLGAARDRLQMLNTNLEGAVAERTADLTRANDEIQRFAYIVSHDLRSPLVNVMGFTAELDTARGALAELVDRADEHMPGIVTEDARIAAKEDLPEAIGFIRTSTQKMDRLINAILKLSREGRRVLTPEPLDLADIAATARDSIRHLADERGAEIVIEQPMPSLVGDRVAIEQVLSNLVENAVKYLSPDRPGRIIVRAQAKGQRRMIEVADNGRGIAAQDHDRVFDLFRRSGQQDQPGEGIGLAHVRALVYRLGGTIDLSSTLGEGSTFRVNLPATFSDTGPTT